MSTEALDQLCSQIWALSESEKAVLVRELLMSLDCPRDNSVEQAWNDGIVRRVAQVRGGKATLLSRDEFRRHFWEGWVDNGENGTDTGRGRVGNYEGRSVVRIGTARTAVRYLRSL